MRNIMLIVFTTLLFGCSTGACAESSTQKIKESLQEMLNVNNKYATNIGNKISEAQLAQQTPLKTVVMCSDSRVAIRSFVENPEANVFAIRNIGNQIKTAVGSVVYGVEYLSTPIIMVVGHSGCGAVKAALDGYQSTNPSLQQELDTLRTDPSKDLNQNIIDNVNYQVELVFEQFKDRVLNETLIVVGIIADLHNDFGYGAGKLIFININNHRDLNNLTKHPYLDGLHGLITLANN